MQGSQIASDGNRLSSQSIFTILQSRCTHTVTDQDHAVSAHHLEGSAYRSRVDMDAITDDLSHYMFAVKYSTYNAGSTVQDFRHTVV